MANIAISFSICSPRYLNKAFLVLNFKLLRQHETFISKKFKGTDFKFDIHSYSGRNIQFRCVGLNGKVTWFRWRYFIFINLKLMISNLSITFWNSYSVTPIFSRFYLQVYIWVDSGMMISGFTKNYNSNRTLPYGNNITRALSKIKIKVKISQEDLVYQYALSLTCYVISDPNINPRRKYKTVLSILILV